MRSSRWPWLGCGSPRIDSAPRWDGCCTGASSDSPAPYGTVLQLEGNVPGQPSRTLMRMSHRDAYFVTAAPTVAAVLQILDGTARCPGAHTQAMLSSPPGSSPTRPAWASRAVARRSGRPGGSVTDGEPGSRPQRGPTAMRPRAASVRPSTPSRSLTRSSRKAPTMQAPKPAASAAR